MPRKNIDPRERRPTSFDFGVAQHVPLHPAEGVAAKQDIALSADEEKFVAAFVEYWARRGARLVKAEV